MKNWYLSLFIISSLVICAIENIPLLTVFYEVASAIGTVGLSLGITPSLSIVSKIILMFLMFFGRVGGLTLIYAAIGKKNNSISRYPLTKISIG